MLLSPNWCPDACTNDLRLPTSCIQRVCNKNVDFKINYLIQDSILPRTNSGSPHFRRHKALFGFYPRADRKLLLEIYY